MIEPAMRAQEEAKILGSGHGIDHVGIAVRDLETAKKTYRNLGFTLFAGGKHPNGSRNSGVSLEIGYLELIIQPQNTTGSVASFLAERGAEGIMGVSIEVASLQTARDVLTSNTKRQFKPYNGAYGQSILVPPELTHGAWIEFFQK